MFFCGGMRELCVDHSVVGMPGHVGLHRAAAGDDCAVEVARRRQHGHGVARLDFLRVCCDWYAHASSHIFAECPRMSVFKNSEFYRFRSICDRGGRRSAKGRVESRPGHQGPVD